MRYFLALFALAVVSVVAVLGFRGDISRQPPRMAEIFPDLNIQPKLRPQTTTKFDGFADGQSSRAFPIGTVAQKVGYHDNTAWKDDAYNTGKQGVAFVEVNPVPVTAELLKRGQERFNIYCQPCHGAQADATGGIVKKLGFTTVANLQDARIIKMNDGEIFNTISYGKNTMLGYAGNIPVADRWAIIAYVRALQLSRLGAKDDVPAPVLEKLK
jgi:mono/diheme cytochrome c family protein